MDFRRHLDACNRFEPSRFIPLMLDGRRIGMVRRDNARTLAASGDLFEVTGEQAAIRRGGRDKAALSAAIGAAGASLAARDLAPRPREELFDIREAWGRPSLFTLDRGLVPFIGARGYGVHINGFVRRDGEISLWIGERDASRRVAPGKLDNLVAGGIAAGDDAASTLIKEAHEEASIAPDLAAAARPASAILYRMDVPEGLRDDVLFIYDLETPADFRPRNHDGEIVRFKLMPLEECLRLIGTTDAFKFNVNLVILDFALRHGAIGPEHPDYLALAAGLRAGGFREAEPRP